MTTKSTKLARDSRWLQQSLDPSSTSNCKRP